MGGGKGFGVVSQRGREELKGRKNNKAQSAVKQGERVGCSCNER